MKQIHQTESTKSNLPIKMFKYKEPNTKLNLFNHKIKVKYIPA